MYVLVPLSPTRVGVPLRAQPVGYELNQGYVVGCVLGTTPGA